MIHWPKWLYAAGGLAVIVQDEAGQAALVGDWYESPADIPAAPTTVMAALETAAAALVTADIAALETAQVEALTTQAVPALETTPGIVPARAALETAAAAAGIKVDARWSDRRLLAQIEAAK